MQPAIRALLIEDSRFFRRAVTALLENHGIKVYGAGNGANALTIAASQPVDIVLLDLMLPGMPGFEILQKLRSCPPSSSVPVLILGAARQRSRFLPYEPVDFIPKDDSIFGHLVQCIEEILEARRASLMQARSPLARKRILLVDDSVVALTVQEMALTMRTSYEILVATNGLQAVQKARSERPDLILMDVCMPQMDGYETCQALKQYQETQHIPVIMLSAEKQQEHMKKGFASGCAGYLTKPVDGRKLVSEIENLLSNPHSRGKTGLNAGYKKRPAV